MKIAASTADLQAYVSSQEERIGLLREAGFRYIDFSFYDASEMDSFRKDDWEEYAASLK